MGPLEEPMDTGPIVSFGADSSPAVVPSSSSSDSFPGLGLVSNILNMWQTDRTNKKNREWQEKQNDLAWQRQLQLINEQRAYDSPKAQMQRLMEAGLNPNLIYGSLSDGHSAVSAPNAAGTYQGVAPQFDASIEAQIRALNSQSNLNDSNANRIDSITPHEVDNLIKDTWLKGRSGQKLLAEIGYLDSLRKQADEYSDVLRVQFNNLKFDELNKQLDYILRTGFVEQEVDNYSSRLDIQSQEYKYLSTAFMLQLAGLSAQAQMFLSQANLNSANAKQIRALLPTMQSFYDAQGDKAKAEAAIMNKDLENYGWNMALRALETLAYSFGMIGGALSNFGYKPFVPGSNPIGFRPSQSVQ